MKIALSLTPCECETLFQLSINQLWRDARLRASGSLLLGKGEHATAVAKLCGVSHQSIYNWRHDWARDGGCQLFYYNEAEFSASPPVQRAWSPLGCPHVVTPAHHQRVAVMGASDFAGQQLYHAQAASAVHREIFVVFMGRLIRMK